MKFYTLKQDLPFAERLVESDQHEVRHLHLTAGKIVPEHDADAIVTVICLSGKVDFTASGKTVQLVPGSFLTMEPGERHSLLGLEDSHLLVNLQKVY